MRIIQTFWSGNQTKYLDNNGGWLSEETHWMSWALSCLQAKKFYQEVELYTDKWGKYILIDLLGLPYTKVHIVFDDSPLKSYPSFLWGMAKMYTYSIQSEPFIHIDNDVFIWKIFPTTITESPLIAQNIESDILAYSNSIDEIFKEASFIPEWLIANKNDNKAYNAGIIGGNDLAFIKEFTNLGFLFVENNWESLSKISNINIIPEQFLFYHLTKSKNKKVICVHDAVVQDAMVTPFTDLDIIPFETNFTHFVGAYKKLKDSNNYVKFMMKNYHEEQYNSIRKVLNENKIDTSTIASLHENIYFRNTENYSNLRLLVDSNIDKSNVAVHLKSEILADTLLLENAKKELSNTIEGNIFIQNTFYPTSIKKENYFLNVQNLKNFVFTITPFIKIIKTKFDWDFFNQRLLISNPANIFNQTKFTQSKNNYMLLIPNMMNMTVHEYGIDNFQNIIFQLLREPSTIDSLLEKLSTFINNMEDNNVRLRFENYIIRCLKKYYCLGGISIERQPN